MEGKRVESIVHGPNKEPTQMKIAERGVPVQINFQSKKFVDSRQADTRHRSIAPQELWNPLKLHLQCLTVGPRKTISDMQWNTLILMDL